MLTKDTVMDIEKNDIEMIPLSTAFATYKKELEKILGSKATHIQDGTLLRIPRGKQPRVPLHLNIHLHTSQTDTLVIIAEPNSSVTIIDSTTSDSFTGTHSKAVYILAQEKSFVHYISTQNVSNTVIHDTERIAYAGKDAVVQWTECQLGGKSVSSSTSTFLREEGASLSHRALFLGEHQRQLSFDARALHQASHTTSRLFMHGILADQAKATTHGLIKIEKDCAHCDGYQKQHTLLLSEEAKIDPVPVLEIHNDDVKCSHATTITDINDEQLHYLMSRGIDQQHARKLIIEGFFEPILREIHDDSADNLREHLALKIQEITC